MHREYLKWWSSRLERDMELLIFGHSGTPLLVFPSSMGRFYEWEDFGMVDRLREPIENGQNQLFCVDSVDAESFYNHAVAPFVRIMRYRQYESYILQEVIPFIHHRAHQNFIIASGASFGAYHAANLVFKYPGLFGKLIAMSGSYDLKPFFAGFYDENVYFNNPVDYLPGITDHDYLEAIRRNHLIFTTGDHDMCRDAAYRIYEILQQKSIPATLDVWQNGTGHDWPWWREMIRKHLW